MIGLINYHNHIAAFSSGQNFLIAGFFSSMSYIGLEGVSAVGAAVSNAAPIWYIVNRRHGGSKRR